VVSDCNPIKVTGTTSAASVIFSGKIRIESVRWYNAATAGHLFHLTDGEGHTVLKMRAATDAYTEQVDLGLSWNGLKTDDLDSGEVYIYAR